MKRGWMLNLVLLAAVAALAWFAWRTPSRDEAAAQPLTTLQPARVRHVRLERSGRPDIEVERRGAQWRITAPLQARADEFQVLRMLGVLGAHPAARLPAAGLERFDLLQPAARLTVDDVKLAFGGINTVTREQYVLHGDTVYAVPLRHGAALPADAAALIRRVLLTENEQPVAILLAEFSVRQSHGKWRLEPPSAEAGGDVLQHYVDRWRHASAARAEPYDGRAAIADIRLELRKGPPLVFSILQRTPQLVLWRHDNGLQYSFLAGAGEALLAYPGKPGVDPNN